MKYSFTEEIYDLIDNVANAALTGCDYWCDGVRIVGTPLKKYASEHLASGGTIEVHVPDDEKWYEVTCEQFKAALLAYVWHIYIESNWVGYLDDATAEMVLQLCCFGDVIYG